MMLSLLSGNSETSRSKDRTRTTGAGLPDDILIRVVRAAKPTPRDLVRWQGVSQAFKRVCKSDSVWAGLAARPADYGCPESTWRDICELTPDAKRALSVIWRNARARSVPQSSYEYLPYRQVAYAAHLNAPWLLPLRRSPWWTDRGFIADLVRHGHLKFTNIPSPFRLDSAIILDAFTHDPLIYGRLPDDLRRDPLVLWKAVAYHGCNLKDVPADLRTPALGRMAVASYANAIHHVPEPLGSDCALWLELLAKAPDLLYGASPIIRSTPVILKAAIHGSPYAASRIHWTSSLKTDRDFAAFLVGRHPSLLNRFDDEVRRDLTVALAALHDLNSVALVHPSLYDDEQYVMAFVQRNGNLFKTASPRLRRNDTILRAAVGATPSLLMDLKFPLRIRRDLVALAVAQDGTLLTRRFFADRFGDDKEIVLSALQSCPEAFSYAAISLRSDSSVVTAALKANVDNHAYVVGDIAEDICATLLVAQDARPRPFQRASFSVRDDRAAALSAVKSHGNSLEFVSSRLQNDPEIVAAAIHQNPHAIRYASSERRQSWRSKGGHKMT